VYRLIQNGYLNRIDANNGKRCLQYTGKEFVPLAIYPSYKDINIKILLAENKKLKKDLDMYKSEYDTMIVNNQIMENKVKQLQEERDNLIITIEDLHREIG
jgi:cell division protein FtsB